MNKRNTIQRSLVLKTVREMPRHVTADEVYDVIVKKNFDISRGTVYRNLNMLCDIGEIRKVEIPNGAVRYDRLCHEHYHVICVTCGEIFDVDMDVVADLDTKIKDAKGFTFTGHDIIFKGVCPVCNKKMKGGKMAEDL